VITAHLNGLVYRATDTNLGRQVAIKVLPEAFAQDAERLARFEASHCYR
jgi:serine/threonine protein kinase